MEKFEIKRGISEQEKYLQCGDQTKITPGICRIVENIHGDVDVRVGEILGIMSSLKRQDFDSKLFRKRTAAQIFQDGYVTGCTDAALVFIALARTNGIPSKYIETIDLSWLENGGDLIKGHIYAQSFDLEKKEWIWVDPLMAKIGASPDSCGRIVYKEGLDSWDIGIKDFESLKAAFSEFREKWLAEKNDGRAEKNLS